MAKDIHPDKYGDIMVEVLRPATIGKNDIVFGFQIWDMDDAAKESSILFRARGFSKVDRLASIDGLVTDLWFGDGELLVLEADKLHRFSGGNFKKPSATIELPIKGCKSIAGYPGELYVVGKGIARFDGKKWTQLALEGENAQLTAVVVHDEKAYAAGDEGLLVEIAGTKVRRIATPADEIDFIDMHISKAGVLSLAGRQGICLQGPPDKLVALKAPEDVQDLVGVAEYRDAVYWSGVGEGHGMGVFVQKGKKLEPVFGDLCAELRASGGYLFGTGEGAVFQFDGDEWRGIGLDFDAVAKEWKAEPGDFETGDAEDEDD